MFKSIYTGTVWDPRWDPRSRTILDPSSGTISHRDVKFEPRWHYFKPRWYEIHRRGGWFVFGYSTPKLERVWMVRGEWGLSPEEIDRLVNPALNWAKQLGWMRASASKGEESRRFDCIGFTYKRDAALFKMKFC